MLCENSENAIEIGRIAGWSSWLIPYLMPSNVEGTDKIQVMTSRIMGSVLAFQCQEPSTSAVVRSIAEIFGAIERASVKNASDGYGIGLTVLGQCYDVITRKNFRAGTCTTKDHFSLNFRCLFKFTCRFLFNIADWTNSNVPIAIAKILADPEESITEGKLLSLYDNRKEGVIVECASSIKRVTDIIKRCVKSVDLGYDALQVVTARRLFLLDELDYFENCIGILDSLISPNSKMMKHLKS